MEENSQQIEARPFEPLTPRELDVMRLLAQHLRYQDIANQLSMAVSSVKWFAQQIYNKLGVNNRWDAIQRAQMLGFLETIIPSKVNLASKSNHNLPRQLNRFIGREKEVGEIVDLVRKSPLVTLTGPGGVGKTRLAQVVGGELVSSFQSGVWLVELASVSDPGIVPQIVAETLDLVKVKDKSYVTILLNYMRDKQLFLILDTCEHVLEASARLSETLLQRCTQLSIMATSREALHIHGEVTYRVPPLNAPEPTGNSGTEPGQSEAVQLFVDRATAVYPRFKLTDVNTQTAAHICYRLDGIPLAIELAAAQVEVLTLEQIANLLNDQSRFFSNGSRTSLPRQRTLQASIDWSYSLLSETERQLLQRLSTFSGNWTMKTAEEMCVLKEIDEKGIHFGLYSLVNKSLVEVDPVQNEEVHYHLLEMVRQFVAEKLAKFGDSDAIFASQANDFADPKEKANRIGIRNWP